MTILWLTEFYPKTSADILGGVPARCFYVGKTLSTKVNLKVIQGVPDKFAKASFLSFFVRLFYLPLQFVKGLTADFDLIEGSNFVTYFPAWLLGKLKGKPVVFWYADVYLGSWVKNVGPVGVIGELAERIVLTLKPDHFIAISNVVKEKLMRHGIAEQTISVIYCGVDPTEIAAIPKPKTRSGLVVVSRLIGYKNIDKVIDILKRIKTYLTIIGWGPEEDALKSQAANLPVTFLGKVPSHTEVLTQVAKAQVFCHPSSVEGFGISILEALSLGTPVLVADTPIAKEVTKNFQGALVFNEENVKLLLSDKKLWFKKSTEGLALARSYAWSHLADQTLKLYEKLLKN